MYLQGYVAPETKLAVERARLLLLAAVRRFLPNPNQHRNLARRRECRERAL
jgi:hypothetical protein